jgi:hypothetical protein
VLEQKTSKARGRAATERVKDQEALHPGAMVRELPDPVEHQIDHLILDCVVGARS